MSFCQDLLARMSLWWEKPYEKAVYLGMPFARHALRVRLLDGPCNDAGSRGRLLVVGWEPQARYLVERFFNGRFTTLTGGAVPSWSPRRGLHELMAAADMTLFVCSPFFSRLFGPHSALAIPGWVDMVMRPDDQGLYFLPRSKSMKNEQRKVKRHAFEIETSRRMKDFEHFYDTMYLPFIRKRHGDLSLPMKRQAMERRFKNGELVFVKHEGRRIFGELVFFHGDVMHRSNIGTKDGMYEPIQMGCMIATANWAMEQGQARGCRCLNFGGTRPSLKDGVFRFKNKWRCEPAKRSDVRFEFRVHWKNLTAPVREFLRRMAPIYRSRRGLTGLAVYEEKELARMVSFSKLPGLSHVRVLADSRDVDRIQGSNLEAVVQKKGMSSFDLLTGS